MDKNILNTTIESIEEQKIREQSKDKYDKTIEYTEGIYIYISFDLINSTLFKSRHMNWWSTFISAFYETVLTEFGIGQYRGNCGELDGDTMKNFDQEMAKTGGVHLWKLVGDEVLLYHKVVSKDELYNMILFVDRVRKGLIDKTIDRCIDRYSNIILEKNVGDNQNNFERIIRQYFAVKTTVWLGSCASKAQNVELGKPNVIYDSMTVNFERNTMENGYDFLGPDIDEGFRLCGFAEKDQMIVSPKLVYLLLLAFQEDNDKCSVLNLNFKIVNYVQMKGVWEQRLYPIIMFCQNTPKSNSGLKHWKDQFEYDAFENSALYTNIDKYGSDFLNDERFSIFNLIKIYKDIRRTDEVEILKSVLENQEKELMDHRWPADIGKAMTRFEFHISCLCYDARKKKYWVTNHPVHGWSFGCVQVKKNKEYYDSVVEAYKEKYNLGISLDDTNPILSFYSVDRKPNSEGNILGVVILVKDVKVLGEEKVRAGWYSYEEMMELPEKKIGNFNGIIKKANEIVEGSVFFGQDGNAT